MLKAKFQCTSVQPFEGGETAYATPVFGDGTGNETFSQATPSGNLVLTITNPEAFGFFEPGKEYFLDINKAE